MLFMLASTCQNMALILSRLSYLHWENVFFTFSFPEFESVQTIKLIVSSKITFAVLFLTILHHFVFFSAESSSCNLVAA